MSKTPIANGLFTEELDNAQSSMKSEQDQVKEQTLKAERRMSLSQLRMNTIPEMPTACDSTPDCEQTKDLRFFTGA